MAGTEFDSGDGGSMPRIVHTEGVLGGEPRLEDRRVGVYQLYERYVDLEETPEEIAAALDLELAEVLAALAYAFDNTEEMRRVEERHREVYEETDRVTPDDVD